MTPLRTIFTIFVAASLAVLPARVGAASFSGAGKAMASMADCAAIDDGACNSTVVMAAAGKAEPTSLDGCDRVGDRGTTPEACYTYCNIVPGLAMVVSFRVDDVLIAPIALVAGTILDGIGLAPEPHPPKLT